MCRSNTAPAVAKEFLEEIDEDVCGFGDTGDPMGFFTNFMLNLDAGEIPADKQFQLLRRVHMRVQEGDLGLTSVKLVGEYAHLAALARTCTQRAEVVRNMPCVAWFREQLVKPNGGESKIAAMAREQLEIFAVKYQGVGGRRGCTGHTGGPGTDDAGVHCYNHSMADPSNRVSQAAMATVVSLHMRSEWLKRA